ncbi:hypothetical protein E2C01_011572 [Portunus trituberculatus]|uniref:Uncharacterized protein n=1 Tax=Portunus trituberculatus TaxID=210409 RepID=A0A5B7DBR3_PORTR|nr:hypothetical protein [Portunus trituberculatus]
MQVSQALVYTSVRHREAGRWPCRDTTSGPPTLPACFPREQHCGVEGATTSARVPSGAEASQCHCQRGVALGAAPPAGLPLAVDTSEWRWRPVSGRCADLLVIALHRVSCALPVHTELGQGVRAHRESVCGKGLGECGVEGVGKQSCLVWSPQQQQQQQQGSHSTVEELSLPECLA